MTSTFRDLQEQVQGPDLENSAIACADTHLLRMGRKAGIDGLLADENTSELLIAGALEYSKMLPAESRSFAEDLEANISSSQLLFLPQFIEDNLIMGSLSESTDRVRLAFTEKSTEHLSHTEKTLVQEVCEEFGARFGLTPEQSFEHLSAQASLNRKKGLTGPESLSCKDPCEDYAKAVLDLEEKLHQFFTSYIHSGSNLSPKQIDGQVESSPGYFDPQPACLVGHITHLGSDTRKWLERHDAAALPETAGGAIQTEGGLSQASVFPACPVFIPTKDDLPELLGRAGICSGDSMSSKDQSLFLDAAILAGVTDAPGLIRLSQTVAEGLDNKSADIDSDTILEFLKGCHTNAISYERQERTVSRAEVKEVAEKSGLGAHFNKLYMLSDLRKAAQMATGVDNQKDMDKIIHGLKNGALKGYFEKASVGASKDLSQKLMSFLGSFSKSEDLADLRARYSPQATLRTYQRGPFHDSLSYLKSETPVDLGDKAQKISVCKELVEATPGEADSFDKIPQPSAHHRGVKHLLSDLAEGRISQEKTLVVLENSADINQFAERMEARLGENVTRSIDCTDGITKIKWLSEDNGETLARVNLLNSAEFSEGSTLEWDKDHVIAASATVRGFIQLPTGTGKTAIFSEVIEQYMGEETGDRKKHALVTVNTRSLREQTVEELQRFAPGLKVAAFSSNSDEWKDADVVVACYKSLSDKAEVLAKQEFDLIVLDEAHEALGDDKQQVLRGDAEHSAEAMSDGLHTLVSSFTDIIGCTATPAYLYKTNRETFRSGKTLGDLLPHKIASMSLQEAQARGYLAPLDGPPKVEVVSHEDLNKARKAISKTLRNGSQAETVELAANDKLEAALDSVKAKLAAGKKIIVRCGSGLSPDLVAQAYQSKSGCKARAFDPAEKKNKASGALRAQIVVTGEKNYAEVSRRLNGSLETAVERKARFEAKYDKLEKNLRGIKKSERKVIIFCNNKDDVDELTRRLNGLKGYQGRVESFKANDQQGYLAFKNGDIDVLVATKVADQGIDLPELRVGIFWDGQCTSKLKREQQIGRVLRIDRDDPLKSAKLVELVVAEDQKKEHLLLKDVLDDETVQKIRSHSRSTISRKKESFTSVRRKTTSSQILRFHEENQLVESLESDWNQGKLQTAWLTGDSVKSACGLSTSAFRDYIEAADIKEGWLEVLRGKQISGRLWVAPTLVRQLSDHVAQGGMPGPDWRALEGVCQENGWNTEDLQKRVGQMARSVLFDEQICALSGGGYILNSRGITHLQNQLGKKIDESFSDYEASLPEDQQKAPGVERYRGAFAASREVQSYDELPGEFDTIESAHKDIHVNREKGLALERLVHLSLLSEGIPAVPQALLKNKSEFILPDFYDPDTNQFIEVKWGGDGPGIARALAKGKRFIEDIETDYLPEGASYRLIHYIDNPSLKGFEKFGIPVSQISPAAAINDSTTAISKLFKELNEALENPDPEIASSKLRRVRVIAETLIANRLSDSGRDFKSEDYSALVADDFERACHRGKDETFFVEYCLQHDQDRAAPLPVEAIVYLADGDCMSSRPVHVETLELIERVGLEPVRAGLLRFQKSNKPEELARTMEAFCTVGIPSEVESPEFAVTLAAAEGIMKKVGHNFQLNQKTDLNSPAGRRVIAQTVDFWMDALCIYGSRLPEQEESFVSFARSLKDIRDLIDADAPREESISKQALLLSESFSTSRASVSSWGESVEAFNRVDYGQLRPGTLEFCFAKESLHNSLNKFLANSPVASNPPLNSDAARKDYNATLRVAECSVRHVSVLVNNKESCRLLASMSGHLQQMQRQLGAAPYPFSREESRQAAQVETLPDLEMKNYTGLERFAGKELQKQAAVIEAWSRKSSVDDLLPVWQAHQDAYDSCSLYSRLKTKGRVDLKALNKDLELISSNTMERVLSLEEVLSSRPVVRKNFNGTYQMLNSGRRDRVVLLHQNEPYGNEIKGLNRKTYSLALADSLWLQNQKAADVMMAVPGASTGKVFSMGKENSFVKESLRYGVVLSGLFGEDPITEDNSFRSMLNIFN